MKLLSDPAYVYYEGRVIERFYEELPKAEHDLLLDWLFSFNTLVDVPDEWRISASVPFLYLLRDKRSMKGGLNTKALGWKAWNLENVSSVANLPRYCMSCGQSVGDVNYDDVAGWNPWYLLKDSAVKYIEKTFTVHVSGANKRVLLGDIVAGNHMVRGLLVCNECVDVVRALDHGRTSVLSGLLDRADDVRMKEVEKLALRELPRAERYRLLNKVEAEKAMKRRLKRGAESNVAIEFEMGADGKLRQKES